jgi:hypothetical protein
MAPKLQKVVDNDSPPPEGHNAAGNLPIFKDPEKFGWVDQKIKELEATAEEKAAASKAATKTLNNARNLIKTHGAGLAEYDYARRLADLNDPIRAAELLGELIQMSAMLGITMDDSVMVAMSVDPYQGLPIIERDRAVWKQKGKIAAISGKGAFAGDPPDGIPPDCFQAWAEGVNEGHDEIASRMKKAGPLFDDLKAKIGGDGDEDGDDE